MSTLHHQPLWLSLRNTNQLSAPYSLTLSPSFSPSLTPSHFLPLSLSLHALSCWRKNKCCITILILAWACRFCFFSLSFFFFIHAIYACSKQWGAGTEWRIRGLNLNDFYPEESGEKGSGEKPPLISLSPPLLVSPSPMDPCMQLVRVYRICLPLILIN